MVSRPEKSLMAVKLQLSWHFLRHNTKWRSLTGPLLRVTSFRSSSVGKKTLAGSILGSLKLQQFISVCVALAGRSPAQGLFPYLRFSVCTCMASHTEDTR